MTGMLAQRSVSILMVIFLMTALTVTASWELIDSSLNKSWIGLTISESGQFSTAASYDGIYHSIDKGTTWRKSLIFKVYGWNSITSSNSGQVVVAVVIYGGIYMSSDFGIHWKLLNAPSPQYWFSVAVNGDGQIMYAADFLGGIWCSRAFGVDWRLTSAPTTGDWHSIAISSSGQFVFAVQNGGFIYVSSDGGDNWRQVTTGRPLNWIAVSCSRTGQRLAATVQGGEVYLSVDFGMSWDAANSSVQLWGPVAVSGSGLKVLAATTTQKSLGKIYQSLDWGETWQVIPAPEVKGSPTQRWSALASDFSGERLLASRYGGQLYQSNTD